MYYIMLEKLQSFADGKYDLTRKDIENIYLEQRGDTGDQLAELQVTKKGALHSTGKLFFSLGWERKLTPQPSCVKWQASLLRAQHPSPPAPPSAPKPAWTVNPLTPPAKPPSPASAPPEAHPESSLPRHHTPPRPAAAISRRRHRHRRRHSNLSRAMALRRSTALRSLTLRLR